MAPGTTCRGGMLCKKMTKLIHAFPACDVAFLGREGYAHFGDGATVLLVFVGIAAQVDLLEGSVGGAIVSDFHDIDTAWHFQDDVGAAFRRWLLSGDVSPESGEQGVKGDVVVVLPLLVEIIGDAGEECAYGLDEGRQVVGAAKLVEGAEKGVLVLVRLLR